MALELVDDDTLYGALHYVFGAWIAINGLLFQGLGIAAAVLVVAVTLSRDARVRRAEEIAYRERQANRIRWQHEYTELGPRISVTNASDEPIFDLVLIFASTLRAGGDFEPRGQSTQAPANRIAFLGVGQSVHFYGDWTTHRVTPMDIEANDVYAEMEWSDAMRTGWTTAGFNGAVAMKTRRMSANDVGWAEDPPRYP